MDDGSDLPPDHGANVSHEAGGFTQFASLKCLSDNNEAIMHAVVEFVGPKRAQKEIAYAFFKESV